MQRSLFVLLILGQCLSVTCQLYHYRFIKQKKTWEDAQRYCRKNHTDLATVASMEDVTRLLKAAEREKGDTSEAWIGLKNDGDLTWYWSLPGVEVSETNWNDTQPDHPGKEYCGWMWRSGKWNDAPCHHKKNFVCYDATTKKIHLIDQPKNWFEAQSYCRKTHTDLVSGMNQLSQVTTSNSDDDDNDARFIGLFSDSWKWSDGRNVSFRLWDPEFLKDQPNDIQCATTFLNQSAGNETWRYTKCDSEKTFFCYDVDKLVLITDSKTWTEALDFCRTYHTGLVPITNHGDRMLVQEILKNATTEYVWLGLHYSCVVDLWLWVTDEPFCDDSCHRYQLRRNECGVSAAMSTKSPYNWTTQHDTTPFNFICVN